MRACCDGFECMVFTVFEKVFTVFTVVVVFEKVFRPVSRDALSLASTRSGVLIGFPDGTTHEIFLCFVQRKEPLRSGPSEILDVHTGIFQHSQQRCRTDKVMFA